MRKCDTYIAYHNNNTFKVGYAYDPFYRVKRGLVSSSDCFLCISAEHESVKEAQRVERMIKGILKPFRIKNAQCKEWHHSKMRGVKAAVIRALSKVGLPNHKIAEGIGVKANSDFDDTELEDVIKLIKKYT